MADESQVAPEVTDNFEVVTDEAATLDIPVSEPDQSPATDQKPDTDDKTPDTPTEQVKEPAPSAEDASAEPEPQKKQGQSRFQKRIDRLTARATAAERERDELKAKLDADKKPESKDEDEDNEPEPGDFDSYDDYIDKLADWKAAQKQPKQEPKQEPGDKDNATPQVSEEFQDAIEDSQESFDEARKVYKDFDEKVYADNVKITEEMVIAIAETDNPGETAYYLATHEKEAEKIAAMTPRAQAIAIGKLEAKLAAKQPLPKKTTEAPDPINPVKGQTGATKELADMSYSEFEAAVNEKEKGRRGFW